MNKFEQLFNSVLNESKSHIQELADQIAQQKNVIKTEN